MFSIKKIIIVIVLVVLAFIGYSMLIPNKNKTSATGVTKQAVNNTNTSAGGQSVAASLDGPGKEFVAQLLAIQNIKFNVEIFADPVFKGLQDWSREIQPQESGRPNPFAPLDGESAGLSTVSSGFTGNIQNSSVATSTNTRLNNESKSTTAPSSRTNTSTR